MENHKGNRGGRSSEYKKFLTFLFHRILLFNERPIFHERKQKYPRNRRGMNYYQKGNDRFGGGFRQKQSVY